MQIVHVLARNNKDHACHAYGHRSKDYSVVFCEVNRFGPTVTGINTEEKNKNDNAKDQENNAAGAEKHSQAIVPNIQTYEKYIDRNNDQKKYIWHIFFHLLPDCKLFNKSY